MSTFKTSRKFLAPIQEVFAAFQPERLARWWGPAGFTNTFNLCEFKTGGRWSFVMHGPDGTNYPNENTFAEIIEPTRVVIQHISEPKFRLTITLEATADDHTNIFWAQAFEDSEVAKRVEHIVTPANEQNLDRFLAEVKKN